VCSRFGTGQADRDAVTILGSIGTLDWEDMTWVRELGPGHGGPTSTW
jgi:hypothetical protein